MEAKELRIGNYVQALLGEVMQVTILGDLEYRNYIHAKSEVEGSGVNIFYPIPLTEDWVVKFGFKDGGQSSKIYSIFKIGKSDGGGYDLHVGNAFNTITTQETKVHLQYVHQLQNLFHALTGEELTIK